MASCVLTFGLEIVYRNSSRCSNNTDRRCRQKKKKNILYTLVTDYLNMFRVELRVNKLFPLVHSSLRITANGILWTRNEMFWNMKKVQCCKRLLGRIEQKNLSSLSEGEPILYVKMDGAKFVVHNHVLKKKKKNQWYTSSVRDFDEQSSVL